MQTEEETYQIPICKSKGIEFTLSKLSPDCWVTYRKANGSYLTIERIIDPQGIGFKFNRLHSSRNENDFSNLQDWQVYRDQNAFTALYKRHNRILLSYAFWNLLNVEDAEDVVNHVWLKIYQKPPQQKEDSSFYNYLITVLINLMIDTKRKRKTMDKFTYAYSIRPPPKYETPIDNMLDSELSDTINKIITTRLSDKQRIAVSYLREGYSYKEIGKSMNVALGTVKSHLNRAFSKIREELTEYYEIG